MCKWECVFLSLAVGSAVSCWVLVIVLAKEAIVLFIVVSRPSTGSVFISYVLMALLIQ